MFFIKLTFSPVLSKVKAEKSNVTFKLFLEQNSVTVQVQGRRQKNFQGKGGSGKIKTEYSTIKPSSSLSVF